MQVDARYGNRMEMFRIKITCYMKTRFNDLTVAGLSSFMATNTCIDQCGRIRSFFL